MAVLTRSCLDGRSRDCPFGEEHTWDVRCPRDRAALIYYSKHPGKISDLTWQSIKSELYRYSPATQRAFAYLKAYFALQEAADAQRSFLTRD